MEIRPGGSRANSFYNISRIASIAIIVIGCLTLVGWIFNVEILKSFMPGGVSMNPLSAIAFSLCAAALYIKNKTDHRGSVLATGFLIVVLLFGFSRVLGYLFLSWDPHLDGFLFTSKLGQNKMAPNSAMEFVILSCSLLFLDVKTARDRYPSQFLAFAGMLIALFSLVGYLYEEPSFYRLTNYKPMAFNTAIAFGLLSVAILCSRPERGFMANLTSMHPGGIVSRRLILPAVIIPVIFGWLRLAGEEAGLFGPQLGVALMTIMSILLFGFIILKTASLMERMDANRRKVEGQLASSQTELQEQTNLLQSILKNMGDGVVVADENGKFVLFNPAAEEILGIGMTDSKPDEWSKHYGVFSPDQKTPYPPDQLPLVRAIRGESVNGTELFIRKANAPEGVWISVSARPIKDAQGRRTGGVSVFSNITLRKKAEQEIHQLQEQLQSRLSQLTALNQELEAFTYSVSHDLRAPLRHIGGFSELLQRSSSTVLDEKGLRYLRLISESAKRMGDLIDDLLAFSKMGRTQMRTTHFSLQKLTEEVIAEFRQDTNGRNIIWRIDPLPVVTADPAMLKLVLVNLISNAVKYTGTRTDAQIQIGHCSNNNHEFEFFVRDNGVGFEMEYIDKLFGVFQRLHTSEEFEGTGIGLANVRRIIGRHGGRTWAEGSVGVGATFYFSLPKFQEEEIHDP
jgi:signal transduction histidine kinase